MTANNGGMTGWRMAARTGIAAVALLLSTGCMMMGNGQPRPAEAEFGMGPRTSAGGRYQATLEAPEPLRVRRMHTVRLKVTSAGAPVEGATITVDGGMPHWKKRASTAARPTSPTR